MSNQLRVYATDQTHTLRHIDSDSPPVSVLVRSPDPAKSQDICYYRWPSGSKWPCGTVCYPLIGPLSELLEWSSAQRTLYTCDSRTEPHLNKATEGGCRSWIMDVPWPLTASYGYVFLDSLFIFLFLKLFVSATPTFLVRHSQKGAKK